MIMTTAIVAVIFAVILVGLEVLHYKERKDLCNRIMSKDYKEYKNIDNKPHRPISKHEKMLAKWRGVDITKGD